MSTSKRCLLWAKSPQAVAPVTWVAKKYAFDVVYKEATATPGHAERRVLADSVLGTDYDFTRMTTTIATFDALSPILDAGNVPTDAQLTNAVGQIWNTMAKYRGA